MPTTLVTFLPLLPILLSILTFFLPTTLASPSSPTESSPTPPQYELSASWVSWAGWALILYDVASVVGLGYLWMSGRLGAMMGGGGGYGERERWEEWGRRERRGYSEGWRYEEEMRRVGFM